MYFNITFFSAQKLLAFVSFKFLVLENVHPSHFSSFNDFKLNSTFMTYLCWKSHDYVDFCSFKKISVEVWKFYILFLFSPIYIKELTLCFIIIIENIDNQIFK